MRTRSSRMRQATLSLLGIMVVAGSCECEDDEFVAPVLNPFENVTVVVVTTGLPLDPDGYMIQVQYPDRMQSKTYHTKALVNGRLDLTYPIGVTAQLELQDVHQYCTVAPPNPRVAPPISTRFDVTCTGAGDIEVSTATRGSQPDADGYTIAVDADVHAIDSNGMVQFAGVTPELHSVALGDVAPNCSVTAANPRNVLVSPAQTTQVLFDVFCTNINAAGTLMITTGSAASDPADLDPDGYLITVGTTQRAIGGTDTLFLEVAAGTHTATLSGLASNCTPNVTSRTETVAIGDTAFYAFGIQCAALTEIIQDGFDATLDWSVTVLEQTGPTTQTRNRRSDPTAPDNDGWHLRLRHDHSGPSRMHVLHVFDERPWNPAVDGAIEELAYSEYRTVIGNNGDPVETWFAVIQNGQVYVIDTGTVSVIPFGPPVWSFVERTQLHADSFVDIGGVGLRPDFSATAAELRFGFVRRTSTAELYPFDTEHAIDRWKVRVRRVRTP